MKNQTEFPKVLFAEGNLGLAGVGRSAQIGKLVFGAQDFFPYPRKGQLWEKFPVTTFFSPRKFKYGKIEKKQFPFALPERMQHSPSYPEYKRALQALLDADLQKAVFARKTVMTYDKPLNPFLLLRNLVGKGLLFFFQMDPETTFLGSTPEWLFRREGRQLSTAAIAGTRTRGRGKELLHSKKDLQEFRFVQKELAQTLSPLCSRVLFEEEPQLLQTPNVEHLFTPFSAELKQNISDQDLLGALHPTPATGGLPKKEALQKLHELESFDRGWFAAPVGYMEKERSHFFVAIRSALIKRNELHLFAGSGILNGSNCYDEWSELNNKLKLWTM
ncbi:MAG: isochorismate synthase [Candidatus Algichlamydia australiensis]|nr:isochorismate synthase [Chlamydiales bacterium]